MTNLLLTPHQKVLEDLGAYPDGGPSMLKTAKQKLFEESGMIPRYEEGGEVESPEPRFDNQPIINALKMFIKEQFGIDLDSIDPIEREKVLDQCLTAILEVKQQATE